jgi:CRP/FNR family transcriptional activator FtrB
MPSHAETLSALPIFGGLPHEQLKRLTRGASMAAAAAGERIFSDGVTPTHCHVLLRGMVELSKRTGQRRCGVLILSQGDVFMPVAALFDAPYLTSAHALTPVTMMLLDAEVLRRESSASAELGLRIAQIIGGHWRMAVRQILDLKCRNAPQRLASLLLRIVDEARPGQPAEVPFPKRRLAARVGMRAESLSRALQVLADNGLHLRGHRIIVRDRSAIEKFCGPDPYPERDETKRDIGLF